MCVQIFRTEYFVIIHKNNDKVNNGDGKFEESASVNYDEVFSF